MKIGLIDVDGHNFPNLPHMKISQYHKFRSTERFEEYDPKRGKRRLKRMAKYQAPPASESDEQINLFTWAAYSMGSMPDLQWMYHIPNGGKRDITTAKRLKAEGVKAGVPDVCLPIPRGVYHGLYIELKAGKNKTTDNQDRWLAALDKNGYLTAVCYGWEEASKVITDYLKNGGRANV